MSNTLQKITARAKQIHKAQPKKKWTDCIKQASRELKRSGKLGSATKPKKDPNRQTGSSSLAFDKRVRAKAPGKRVVKHPGGKSTVYYERRKNRSDKPGSLAGHNMKNIISDVKRSKDNFDRLKLELKEYQGKLKAAKDPFRKLVFKQKVDRLKYELRERKQVLSSLATQLRKIK